MLHTSYAFSLNLDASISFFSPSPNPYSSPNHPSHTSNKTSYPSNISETMTTMSSSSSSIGKGGHMHASDPSSSPTSLQQHNETLLGQKQLATAYPPTARQQEACLHEIQSFAQGNLPFLTTTPENPVSARRPPAQRLEEKGLIAPGVARATQAASVEKPFGSPADGPNYKKMGTPLRSVSESGRKERGETGKGEGRRVIGRGREGRGERARGKGRY